MKYALISPNESVPYVSSWELIGNQYVPVSTVLGQRIAEVTTEEFEVASPLFWFICSDDVTSDSFYFDVVIQQIVKIPESPLKPENPQPAVDGAQAL